MIDPRPVVVAAFIVALETPAPPVVGLPGELVALGRDLIVASVLFYFYRQIANHFKEIVEANTAAMQRLSDKVETVIAYHQHKDEHVSN